MCVCVSMLQIVGMATSSNIARQTTLWSATMPESLERLARSAVVRPVSCSKSCVHAVCVTCSTHTLLRCSRLIATVVYRMVCIVAVQKLTFYLHRCTRFSYAHCSARVHH